MVVFLHMVLNNIREERGRNHQDGLHLRISMNWLGILVSSKFVCCSSNPKYDGIWRLGLWEVNKVNEGHVKGLVS